MGMDFYISKLFSCMFLAAICVGTLCCCDVVGSSCASIPDMCVIEGNNWQNEQLYVFLAKLSVVDICMQLPRSDVILPTCFSALCT